jgi:hypothetical protein
LQLQGFFILNHSILFQDQLLLVFHFF